MPDAVVIGSGPNGLVAANVLVDAGWSVTVCEAEPVPGGAVRTSELTVPGFCHDLFSAFYPLAIASSALSDLRLEQFGLTWCHAPTALAHALADGRCAEISSDLESTVSSLEALSPGDGESWRALIDAWQAIEEPLLELLFEPFPRLRAGARLARSLGILESQRLLRQALLPVRRLAEEQFQSQGARLLLGGCALHTDLSPEAAGSGFYGWLLACLAQRVGFPVPQGGAGALTDALVARFESRGGTVCCDAPVREVIVKGGRAVGVWTVSGERVEAKRAVLADVPAPSLYGSLVAATHLPTSVLADLKRFQWDTATVKVDWALAAPLPWQAPGLRRAGTVHVADSFDELTRYAAEIAMGELASRPFLIVGQQSVADPTRSPSGTATAWAYTHVPREVRADAAGEISALANEQWLPAFVERIEARIEALAPGFSSAILGRHVFSPAALERANRSLEGGAIGGGTSQLHQQLLLRPLPGWGRPETPIVGLYLASASAHPGGGVHGAAGANAAHAARSPLPRARALAFGRASRAHGSNA